MKIHLVSVLDGIDNFGVRKFSAYVRSIYPDTEVSFVIPGNYRSLINMILPRDEASLGPDEIAEIAESTRGADVVGFSSMSGYAPMVKSIISEIRRQSPNVYIIWGGIHPIMDPDDAILHADAVCTGEGEFAFEILARALSEGRDPSLTPGFWFRPSKGRGGSNEIIRNTNLPLMTAEEMEMLPFQLHQQGEKLYEPGVGFRPMTTSDFIAFHGISYRTIWSIGCPFKCSFCGNSKFIDYDQGYRRIRHPSPDYVVAEIKAARERHPFISEIIFSDDSFLALKPSVLEEFATKFKDQIDLPFYVAGVIPNYVRDEKIDILIAGGLNRLRMGIQSGSERILKFYDRPTPLKTIRSALLSIGKFTPYMVAPAYDIILDNPIERKEDVLATLDMVHEMPRPFTLNLFSLRVIPGTILEQSLREHGVETDKIDTNYWKHSATFANCLIYLLILIPLPDRVYRYLRKFVLPSHLPQRRFKMLMVLLRTLYLIKRACQHLVRMDFTTLPGRYGYLAWRTGIVGWWRPRMLSTLENKLSARTEKHAHVE